MRQDAPLVIFLSPHFDDIALSCGGIAARLARSGARCIAVTVCAAPAPSADSLSDYALQMQTRWESASHAGGEQAINEVRREEERQAARLLGIEPRMLDLPDAPYRRGSKGEHLYTSDADLFAIVAPQERRTLVPSIAEEVARIAREVGIRGRPRVFAPLGIGHHVDHQLVFWAARRLGPRYGVLFYEDYPYATREGALRERIQELRLPMQPRLTPITDLIGVKIAAIARYKSQLEILFGSSEAMPAAVRAYAQSVAGASPATQYAERFWYIPPIYTLREMDS
jgi:LmbE family N-acetylglucosaminyl deacetylase